MIKSTERIVLFVFLLQRASCWLPQPLKRASRAKQNVRAASNLVSPSFLLKSTTIPTLDEWEVMGDGTLVGTVSGHPAIEDGDVIATSPLKNPCDAAALAIVTTMSGSQYKLGIPSLKPQLPKDTNGASEGRTGKRTSASIAINPQKALMDAQKHAEKQYQMIIQNYMGGGLRPQDVVKDEPSPRDKQEELMEAQRVAKVMYEKALKEARRAAQMKYDLNGEIIGGHMLSGKPIKSTSGKSQIWTAYKSDDDGLPTGESVIIKVSGGIEAMGREYENYKKATSGFYTGQFVKQYEFLPRAGESKQLYNQCALVMEKGARDLKNYLSYQEGMRLEGGALRDAAMAAAKCLQAFHSSNLVWTDLKPENFVVMEDSLMSSDKLDVRGIDLESAMPYRGNPVDYSPESCPPEFAQAFLQGDAPYFELCYSYDIWSYGIYLYELSTGAGAFDGKTPAQVTKTLCDPDHEIDIQKVENPRLRNLIKACLRKDPSKRPSINQIMMHSYFLSGMNPFGFVI
mmetsp:Transcript_4889/g.9036  ORF Transcript_4889/g.9036 Transcript_4889/m.9036 type:complete len:513 (-) Transcript_4889:1061-2599(-)